MSDYSDEGVDYLMSANSAWRVYFWNMWDEIKHKRFKLKWGWLRPSFKLEALEPLMVKLIGERLTAVQPPVYVGKTDLNV